VKNFFGPLISTLRKYLHEKSLRWKIIVCVEAALVMMCATVIMLMRIDLHAMSIIEDSYVSNAELNDFLENVKSMENSLEFYVEYRSFESIDTYYTHRARVSDYRDKLHTNPSTDEILQKAFVVNQIAHTYEDFSNRVIVAKRSNNDDLLKDVFPRARDCYRTLVGQVGELNSLLLGRNAESYISDRRRINLIHRRSLFLFIALLGAVTLLLYFMINSITRPLGEISEVAERVAERDFDVPLFNRDTHDEIGNICRAFDRMIVSIREYIDTIWKKARTENELREKEMEMRALYSDAQLRALQSQINPHFLFNTLNTGSQLAMMEGADKTCYFIEHVADFFRYNIQQRKQTATLDEELGLVDNFVYIMKVRFGRRLEFVKDVPAGKYEERLPVMTIQPLVENCIKHGLKNTVGCVELKVRREDDFIEVRVSDNGEGFDEDVRKKILEIFRKDDGEVELASEINPVGAEENPADHNGIGLINVLLRLKLYFHRDDIFDIPPRSEVCGASFILRIPGNV